MNRDIKFRVWDKEDKRMITHEQEFIPLKVTSMGVLRLDATIKEDRWELVNTDRFELMQYTGLNDKNGTEIYEGDVVKAITSTGEIVFENGCFIIKWIRNKDFFNDTLQVHIDFLKVIGNIYETPSLS